MSYYPWSCIIPHLAFADQSSSCVQLFGTPWTEAHQAPLPITIFQSLLKFMFIESIMLSISSSIIPSPSIANLPSISTFPSESVLHQVAKVLEHQLQHQSFQWIFKVDFLSDWLVWSPWNPWDSQESSPTPQFKSINSSALSFLYVQLSHPYMTMGKTI